MYEMLHEPQGEYWVYEVLVDRAATKYENEYVKKYSRMSANDIYNCLFPLKDSGWITDEIQIVVGDRISILKLKSKRNKEQLIREFITDNKIEYIDEIRAFSHKNKSKAYEYLIKEKC